MKLLKWGVASAAMFGLVACGQDREAPVTPAADAIDHLQANDATQPYLDLVEQTFSLRGAVEADLEAVAAVLPDFVHLTWDAKALDTATGATVLTGMALSFGEEASFGVRADEARIWGMEPDLLVARLQGQRLTETGPLFTRLDALNFSYFGIDTAINLAFADMLSQTGNELSANFEFAVDEFEMSSQRVILTDVALRPWELVKAPDALVEGVANEDERATLLGAVHLGQQLIAVSRSVESGSGVMLDTTTRFAMRQPGATVQAESQFALYGYTDSVGLDMASFVMKDALTRQQTEYSNPDPETSMEFPQGLEMNQESTYALSQASDIRLDALMGYLARSEVPPVEQRDLLSLGIWQVTDYAFSLNDNQIVSVKSVNLQADSFEWILPTSLGYQLDDVTLHVDELTGAFQAFFDIILADPSFGDGDPAELEQIELVREGFDKAMELLPQHGLDTISFDAQASAQWDADIGRSDFAAALEAAGFGDIIYDLSIDLPTYDQVKLAVQSDDKNAAFEQAFEDAFAFHSAHFRETDEGGFDKLLGFAHDIGKAYPNEGWGAMLGGMEPPQMRAYLASILRLGKPEVAGEFPPAADWLEAFALYVETGGAFEIRLDPPEPINAALIDSVGDDPEPDEIVRLLGIVVTHTK